MALAYWGKHPPTPVGGLVPHSRDVRDLAAEATSAESMGASGAGFEFSTWADRVVHAGYEGERKEFRGNPDG